MAALASLPTLGVPFVLTPYANNKFNSLASILGEKGYHTSFFIGHPNGAMGYTAFTQLAGFQHYYGMDEYDNAADSDGLWGIWDHKFLPDRKSTRLNSSHLVNSYAVFCL